MPLTGFRIDAAVVDPRRTHRHRACRSQHLPLGVVEVADHQAVTVLVDLVGELGDVGGDLQLKCRGEHLTGTVAHDVVEQRSRRTGIVIRRLRVSELP